MKNELEDIKLHIYSLNDAIYFIRNGLIYHPSSIISILWLKNNYYDILS